MIAYSSLPEFYLKKLMFLLSPYRCDEYKKVGVYVVRDNSSSSPERKGVWGAEFRDH